MTVDLIGAGAEFHGVSWFASCDCWALTDDQHPHLRVRTQCGELACVDKVHGDQRITCDGCLRGTAPAATPATPTEPDDPTG